MVDDERDRRKEEVEADETRRRKEIRDETILTATGKENDGDGGNGGEMKATRKERRWSEYHRQQPRRQRHRRRGR